jgi:hypothetical protein
MKPSVSVPKTYTFEKQLAQGEQAETRLDAFFARWYDIQPVCRQDQRRGIDRFFTHKETGARVAVEYKTDWTASKTGNAFVETISVDTTDKPGWAFTSQADYLMYYLPGDLLIYVFKFSTIRRLLPRWQRDYPTRRIPNQGYCTHGLLVPLAEFEQHAHETISL